MTKLEVYYNPVDSLSFFEQLRVLTAFFGWILGEGFLNATTQIRSHYISVVKHAFYR